MKKMRAATGAAIAIAALSLSINAAPVQGLSNDALRALAVKKFGGLATLDAVPVPEPTHLDEFVKDRSAAIALGKAFFWDIQVGSDGQACASCHFAAGADNRIKNQLSPGLLDALNPDIIFDPTYSGSNGPNYTLAPEDFPLHKLSDPDNRDSSVIHSTNDTVSSQGTFGGGFVSVTRVPKRSFDDCGAPGESIFNVGGTAVRKVEPRNTPSTINAVFYHRNFWDGRANNIFNGLNPLGERGLLPSDADLRPGVLVLQADGSAANVQVRLDNASLASQAVGPPLSGLEASCEGRSFADIGRKLRTRKPLAFQEVHPSDSVLAPWKAKGRGLKGLQAPYGVMVQKAFHERYWSSSDAFSADGEPLPLEYDGAGYTQMEANWALFFGLAIQLYESTLISGQTSVDTFMRGANDALTMQEKLGFDVFLNKGKCVNCHVGPEFSDATVRQRANQPHGNEESIERMLMGDGTAAVYDGGFYNIGVRPTHEDIGIGAELGGYPISYARQEVFGSRIDDFNFDPQKFDIPGAVMGGERVAVDGAFKVPTVRNVELNGPYFHNGGQATLEQVVQFYNRGGDRRPLGCGDTTRFGPECSNLDPDIVPLGLDENESAALVAFMKALTDDRVRYARAPFDHPQLLIPNGHPGDQSAVTDSGNGKATDEWFELPAVGASGRSTALPTFEENLQLITTPPSLDDDDDHPGKGRGRGRGRGRGKGGDDRP